jgi:5'-nucleotidase / UDP-sugar diphosphatase
MMETIRSENRHVLILDAGGVFSPGDRDFRLSARYLIRGMDQMGYAAMNLGGSELYAGIDFLEEITKNIQFPVVSSNLVLTDGREPFWKPYVIANLGNAKVGIIGVMSADGFSNMVDPRDSDKLKILPPSAALAALVPELEKQADVVILLSQCDLDETAELLNAVQGIDLAISPGGSFATCADIGAPAGETGPMQTSRYGKDLGLYQFIMDDTGQVIPVARKLIPLHKPAPGERLIGEMFNEIKKLRAETGVRDKEVRARAMSTLKLTPEEFIRQFQQEQPDALIFK